MKGSAMVWAMVLIGIFVVSLMWILFSDVIYVHVQPDVYTAITTQNTTDTTEAVNTMNIIEMVWYTWPLILIFGLLFVGIVHSQRREPDQYYM